MADNSNPEYPDLLGYITDGERYNMGVAQVAIGVRPRVVRAGRPFEVIMLVQNASDADVDLTVTLHIPERDINKKKGRFVAKVDRLVVGMQPAEVGYIMLPISCLPDTGPSADYRVGMEINAKPLAKANRVRSTNGGTLDLQQLSDEIRAKIEELKQVHFSSKKVGLRGNAIETQFSVMSGKVGAIADLKPGWTSLWALKDHLDDVMLMQRYWETLKLKVLPAIHRDSAYKALIEMNEKKFGEAGYPLKPIEALFITKLMTLILEYAMPSLSSHGSHGPFAAGAYNMEPLLNKERLANNEPFTLPRWVSTLLRSIAKDERAARFPVQAVLHFGYEALLYDAARLAFEMIETAAGEDLGDVSEQNDYIAQIIKMLHKEERLDFAHIYMPLVLGGVIVYDRVMSGDEKLGDLLEDMRVILNERKIDMKPDDEPIYQIAARLIDQAMMKYGYKGK